MPQQLFYEDVEEGMEIPQQVVLCNTLSLVKWAGVNKDYDPEHYDKDHALSLGLPGPIVNGQFKVTLFARVLTDWAGNDQALRKITCHHRRMDMVGDAITFKGIVRKSIHQDGEHLAECEIWCENPKGEKTVVGTAVVALPSRC